MSRRTTIHVEGFSHVNPIPAADLMESSLKNPVMGPPGGMAPAPVAPVEAPMAPMPEDTTVPADTTTPPAETPGR